jgi:hypothetical protein
VILLAVITELGLAWLQRAAVSPGLRPDSTSGTDRSPAAGVPEPTAG